MRTGDKAITIFLASAACCSVLPFAPGSVRVWAFYGPGAWLIPSAMVTAMEWTIWRSK